MKKFICTLVSILSFIALTGFVGGLECGTITPSQFILAFTGTFLLMISSAMFGRLEQ